MILVLSVIFLAVERVYSRSVLTNETMAEITSNQTSST